MLQLVRTHWRCAVFAAIVGAIAFVAGRCSAPPCPQPEERATHNEELKADVRRDTKLETNTGTITIDRTIEEELPAACPPAPRPVVPRAVGCPCEVLATSAAPTPPGKRRIQERITIGPSSSKLDETVKGGVVGVVKDDLHVKPPLAGPHYRVGALVGAQLVPLAFPPQVMVGGHVEMKLGEIPLVRAPVWAGAWAVTNPQRFPNPTFGGLSVTVELP